MKSFVIARPETHHVVIDDNHFTTEHPLDCDLTSCKLQEQLAEAWEAKPTENGRYQVKLMEGFPLLSDPLPYRLYKVKPLKKRSALP